MTPRWRRSVVNLWPVAPAGGTPNRRSVGGAHQRSAPVRPRHRLPAAMPVSRTRLLVERFAALGVPILLVNLVLPPLIVGGARLVGESPSAADVVAVHLLSIPYLFACAGVGLVCSVVFDRVSVAQRVALGATFALYLLESVLAGSDYEVVGAVTPMRYYDPNAVLLEGTYDLVGAGVLVGATVGLVAISAAWFERKDL